MATNIASLPRKPLTSTQRSRRCRERKAEAARAAAAAALAAAMPATAPATLPAPDNIAAAPRPSDGGRAATIATLIAALGIMSVSGFFNVAGLASVCSGAPISILALGCALEACKLAGIRFLSAREGGGPILRTVMAALVSVLVLLSVVDAYAYFATNRIGAIAAHHAVVDSWAAEVAARRKVQAGILADVDARIRQIDAAIDEATRRGRVSSAMALVDQQRRNRGALLIERDRAARELADIEIEAAKAEGDRATGLAVDDGAVRYAAAMLGISADEALRWYLLLVAALLDPCACALWLAATGRAR